MKPKNTAAGAPIDLDELCVNTIRFLAVDAVQKANSGHPGLPLDAAPMAYVLWTRFLKHDPADPAWFDRDRFVLSAGHGSMLLYSLLHLTGYDLPLDQIEQFRQWGSRTPGHPERGVTPGVEVSTGPLGQGFGNGVGMAIAEAYLAAVFNRPGHEIIKHYTYGIVSDGDLMEGVASEAASLAGHLRLGRLIYLYDNNHVSLSAGTPVTFSEDVAGRFEAYGWFTQSVEDGNDLTAIENAIRQARRQAKRPSLILVHTHLGYGSPHKQDSFEAHGSPLGANEVLLTKKALGWPLDPPFFIPKAARGHFRKAREKGRRAKAAWENKIARYAQVFPDMAAEFRRILNDELSPDWMRDLPVFQPDPKGMATRVAGGKVMNVLAPKLLALIGGSADLDPSTHTMLKGFGDFEGSAGKGIDTQGSAGGPWDNSGRNLHFGVREHAMGAILNGLAAHSGIIPFGATFLVFSDYMRPSIRLAALMGLHVIYVFTHDSVGLGEDGPTHQPVEHLLSLRAIPNLTLIRPADANETVAAWEIALEHKSGPVALVLSRQNLPVLGLKDHPWLKDGVRSGGYVLAGSPDPQVTLVATGSEVHLALAARERLSLQGIPANVVSMPCWQLFESQPEPYRRSVILPGVPLIAIEAGVSLGWRSYVGAGIPVIAVDRFGASAPGEVVLSELGLNLENVVHRVNELLNEWNPDGRKQEILTSKEMK